MAFKITIAAVLLHVLSTLATWSAYEEYASNMPSKGECKRPTISFEPNQPGNSLPESPPRHKTCKVKSHDDMKTDDSKYILNALHEFNNGGRVLFPAGTTYVVARAIDMQFLKHVDIGQEPKLTEVMKQYWLTSTYSHPRLHPVYERHKVLAKPQFQADLPKRNHFLPARRNGRQCLRWRHVRWQRPGLVRPVR